MTETQALLAQFVKSRSETAFRELVARYVNLVYSTAFRLVDADAHRAQDVAQSVFLHLAQKAHTLKSDSALGGWLHRDTCHVAATLMRSERRRHQRELQAAAMNSTPDHSEANLAALAPVLDEAINQLGEADRAAILLRFYEQRDLRSVGETLGSSQNAAQKRIVRALDALRILLKERGVAHSTAALGSLLAGEAVTAAPVGMIGVISASALAGSAKSAGVTGAILKLMAAAKVKTAVIGTILFAGVIAPFMVEKRAEPGIREQDQALQTQAMQIAELKAENGRLSAVLTAAKKLRPTTDPQLTEVLKLRREVSALGGSVAEMRSGRATEATSRSLSADEKLALLKSKFGAQVTRLQDWLTSHPSERIPELDLVDEDYWAGAVASLEKDNDFERAMSLFRRNAEGKVFGELGIALRSYARANAGAMPAAVSDLKPYLKKPVPDAVLERYQIITAGNLVPELQEAGAVVITQTAPVNAVLDVREACGLDTQGQPQWRDADERVTNRWSLVQ